MNHATLADAQGYTEDLTRVAADSAAVGDCTDELDFQSRVESSARSYPRYIPISIAKAQGIHVTSTDGREYLDCLCGAGALPLGHNSPVVAKALHEAIDSQSASQTLDLMSPIREKFMRRVLSILPSQWSPRVKVQFCGPTGTDAVEAAIKLVRVATGRRLIMPFSGSYHGMSAGSMGLTGSANVFTVGGSRHDTYFLPFPNTYRRPFGLPVEQELLANIRYIESLLADPSCGVPLPAAMIIEPIQGEGGVVPAPLAWLRSLRQLCDKYDIPLILDEVQCGVGRSGTLFAFEAAGIVPDVLVLSKAIGGGQPLSLIVYDQKLDGWQPGSHAGTFRGNQLAMHAGLAVIDELLHRDLAGHARRMGECFMQRVDELLTYDCVGDVRGRGLMLGIEFVDPRVLDHTGTPVVAPQVARRVQQACFDRGLICELGGRSDATLRLLPPLTITEAQLTQVQDILLQSIREVTGGDNSLVHRSGGHGAGVI